MFILKIIKNGKTEQSDFNTLLEAQDHLVKYKGKDEYVIHHEEILEVIGQEASVEIPAILDINGVEISPMIPAKEFIQAVAYQAAYDEVIPADYSYSIEDNTTQVEAEKIRERTKKTDRVSRVGQLKAIDWATIDTIAELKTIVRVLVKEAIKDDE